MLQLSPAREWRCLSIKISEEDIKDQDSIEEYIDALWKFLLHGDDNDAPWHELCPADILLKVLCAAPPDKVLFAQEAGGIPHFLDAEGNEYFFGKMFSFDCEFQWDEKSYVRITEEEWKKLVSPGEVKKKQIAWPSCVEQAAEPIFQGSTFVLTGDFTHCGNDRATVLEQ